MAQAQREEDVLYISNDHKLCFFNGHESQQLRCSVSQCYYYYEPSCLAFDTHCSPKKRNLSLP